MPEIPPTQIQIVILSIFICVFMPYYGCAPNLKSHIKNVDAPRESFTVFFKIIESRMILLSMILSSVILHEIYVRESYQVAKDLTSIKIHVYCHIPVGPAQNIPFDVKFFL